MSVSFLVFLIRLNNLLRLRNSAFNFLLIQGFFIFFPLRIFVGIYQFMRSDRVEQNFFDNTCVVEVGSIEVNSSFTRLSSSLIDAKSALL